jgi:hypothetical protein
MEIKIDYENLDVENIMKQIKKRIAARPPQPEEAQEEKTVPELGEITAPPSPSPPPGLKGKIRRVLLKIMRPFAPFIKLLILPVDEELRETVENLDYTNRRLDGLTERLHQELNRIDQVLGRLESKIDLNHQIVNERLDLAFKDLGRAKEYTKLLHQLTHNLVVEITKLKIEEEHLKIQARILEKDLAFLSRREKEIEKKVFP